MDKETHYRKLEKLYNHHPLNSFYQASITISHKASELKVTIKPSFHHAAAAVHGAVYWKLLDDSAFFAANSVVEDVFVLTASFTIYLFKPVSSGVLKAVGKLVYDSKGSQLLAESILFNDQGEEIARGNGVYIRSKVALSPEIGYKWLMSRFACREIKKRISRRNTFYSQVIYFSFI